MMDFLERVKHFIEEKKYNALGAIYKDELAKFGICAVVSCKGLRADDLSASRQAAKFQRTMHVFML